MSKPKPAVEEAVGHIHWLGDVLRQQAIDHHNYRRDNGNPEHVGAWSECKTLRCETVREKVEWAKAYTG